jgi:hypothetical protein
MRNFLMPDLMRRSLFLAMLAVPVGVMAFGTSWPAGAAAGHRPAGPTWQLRYNSASAGLGILTGVVALNSKDVWAVGQTTPLRGTSENLVIRWNGTTWTRVRVTHAATLGSITIAASSATNVWLLGSSSARRWDGHRWHVISAPGGPTFGNNSPVVLGTRNVWTYGLLVNGGCTSTVWHWNGHRWRKSGSFRKLCATGLGGSSAGNIWLVGNTALHGKTPTKAYRWNGVTWRAATLPHPYVHNAYTMFPDVAVSSRTSVWIGDDLLNKAQPLAPGPGFALHWNGHRWTPTPPSVLATVNGIATNGTGGLWLGPDGQWTGSAWLDTTPGPSFGNGLSFQFSALARVPGSAIIWGVGAMQHVPSGGQYPMIASYG